MRLAGTYHPLAYLAERIHQFLPGLINVDGIYLNFNKEFYLLSEKKPIAQHLKIHVQELRSHKHTILWTNEDDIFFSPNKSLVETKQLSFDDDNGLNTLRIYFTSPIDGKKDIFFFTFPDHLFLRNLDTTFQGISPVEKKILEKLIYAVLLADYEKAQKERTLLLQLGELVANKEKSIQKLEEEKQATQELYSNAVFRILEDYKNELEEELGRNILLPKSIVYKLAKENISLEEMKTIIINAVNLLFNIYPTSQELKLTMDLIDTAKVSQENREVNTPSSKSKEDKVYSLLEKYEKAALILYDNRKVLNAKNIAAKLDPPITPPAITDAIKKNKNKIAFLLKQYPDKWKLIRKSIRPISLLNEENNRTDELAS